MTRTYIQEPPFSPGAGGPHLQQRAQSSDEFGMGPEQSRKISDPLAPVLVACWIRSQRGLALVIVGVATIASVVVGSQEAALAASNNPTAANATDKTGADDFTGMNLDELMQVKVPTVYGASKHEQKITEAPSAVSIVTADDIKKYGHRTLRDILNSMRSFYVTHDGIYSFIGMRGVDRPGDFGGRILIMVDGHRMNDPVYDSALSGTEEFLDVDLIERVEVIRGPGSSLYGNNAFFGVINIITRGGQSLNWGEVSASAGSFDTYVGRFTIGHQFTNAVEFIASGTIQDSAGHDRRHFSEFSSINGGVAEHLDSDHGNHVFASVRYHDFSLFGGYNDRRKENSVAAYGVVFNEKPAFVYDQRAFAELKYTHEFDQGWHVLARLFFDHYHFDADYVYDYGGVGNRSDYVLNRDVSLSQFWGGELQVTKTFSEKHRLTFGGEFRDDLHLDLRNFDVVSDTTYVDSNRAAYNFGLYGQGEFELAKPLALNVGVRYDQFATFGDTVNPRAALLYHPWRETAFKVLYGSAFREPNAYEFGYINPSYDANPDLMPENIRSYELVWEQGFAQYYRFTAALFNNDVKDLITRQVNPTTGHFVFRNTDSVTARGGELELEAQWPGGWRSRASYTFADAVDNTGALLSNSPRHLGKVNVVAPLYRDKLFADVEVQVMSDRLTVRGGHVGSFATCNLTLFSREVVKGLKASVSLYNLFDTRYSDPVSVDFRQDAIRQDGRTFRTKLTWRF